MSQNGRRATTYGKLTDLLTRGERRRGLLVIALMFVFACVETIGVASIAPFLAVVGDPSMIERNAMLRWLYRVGGFSSSRAFLVALALSAFLLVMLSAIVRIVGTYVTSRYVQMRRHSVGVRLLTAYLRQPYSYFLNRNSADLSKSVLSEVDTLVNYVFKPGMDLITYGLVITVLAAFLIVLDPVLAMIVTIVVGGAYMIVYSLVRNRLGRMGEDRILANRERFTAASEAFGGIKDLKMLGREAAYLARFERPSHRFADHYTWQATLSVAPKYIIEAVGFGSLVAFTVVLMLGDANLGQVLPVLGLYAFAGYRLLPAAQHVYASVSALRFGLPAVHEVHTDLTAAGADAVTGPDAVSTSDLVDGIRFDSVYFTYPGAASPAVRDLNLVIPARSSLALVGETGAGKTTVADLLLGLLNPDSGSILIDGQALTPLSVRGWQRMIGYVPQSIYLADASVSENIAFGIDSVHIDQAAVERAARTANIHEFVVRELPRGYATTVGERGVRLSGGQRQRIGIARALYGNPFLLVLDEATSALDAGTERAIMEAVDRLSGDKTIVIVAHRMSTVMGCDNIAVLRGGEVVAVGSYDQLQGTSPLFQRLTIA
jgi:ATP-binding cassette, subfamily B, bacterial PglK